MLNNKTRVEALDALLHARMAHTRWVSEVMHNALPCVAAEATDCDFGKWLNTATGELGDLAEFQAMLQPHTDLHEVYKLLHRHPTHEHLRGEIRVLSTDLINAIDALEKRLNRPIR
jgi:hypothetical protein